MTDPSFTIRTVFDRVTRIAVEPVVAHYVRGAIFKMDGTHHRSRDSVAEIRCGGVVIRLLANSPRLEQAGLDWKEYHAEIEDDLEAVRYSQYAAAFLLTLLSNIETLRIPDLWKQLEAIDKLGEAVVCRAKQSHLLSDRPSLAQVTNFGHLSR